MLVLAKQVITQVKLLVSGDAGGQGDMPKTILRNHFEEFVNSDLSMAVHAFAYDARPEACFQILAALITFHARDKFVRFPFELLGVLIHGNRDNFKEQLLDATTISDDSTPSSKPRRGRTMNLDSLSGCAVAGCGPMAKAKELHVVHSHSSNHSHR